VDGYPHNNDNLQRHKGNMKVLVQRQNVQIGRVSSHFTPSIRYRIDKATSLKSIMNYRLQHYQLTKRRNTNT